MKALVVNDLGHGFEIEDVKIDAPMTREVLVDVHASGLCHTDLLFAGIVEAIGPDVTQCQVGDHVVGSLTQACGACVRCLSGRWFQCHHPEATLRRPGDGPRLSRGGIGLFQGFGLLDDLVSRRISLREVNDGYAALKDGSLNRVVVTSF
jgi:S-(hydroxymethyl)glutathione dehydrogenase/alcohol dehydrogenase